MPRTLTSSRIFARRLVCITIISFCCAMAGNNLMSAFATEISPVYAVVAQDTMQQIEEGNLSVNLTLSSSDIKDDIITKIHEVISAEVKNPYTSLPLLTATISSSDDVAKLAGIEGIISIEPNREIIMNANESSDVLPSVDYLDHIHATNVDVKDTKLTGKGIVIGIIDIGFNVNDPMFTDAAEKSRIISQACFQDSSEVAPCPTSSSNPALLQCTTTEMGCIHGTAVAALAAGNYINLTDKTTGFDKSIRGVSFESSLSLVRLAENSKATGITEDKVLLALDKFTQDVKSGSAAAPDVLNLSLGFDLIGGAKCNQAVALHTAVQALTSKGVTVVASTGNSGNKQAIAVPGCFDEVIGVGATEFTRDAQNKITGETVASYSQSSSEIDVVAPGSDLVLATPTPDAFMIGDGTSFATPITAGAVALMKQAYPSLSPSQARDILIKTSDQVNDPALGKTFARINVQKAVDEAVLVATTPTQPTQPPVTATQPPVTATQPPVTATGPWQSVPVTGDVPSPSAVNTVVASQVPVTVLGQQVTNSTSTGSSLPFTGSSSTSLFFVGLWILGAGVTLMLYKEGFSRLKLARS